MNTKYQTRKLRIGRHSERGRVYLVTICCFQKRPILKTFSAGRLVVSVMQAMQTEVSTLSFVVMPDHVHWLIQLDGGRDLSSSVQKLKSLTSRRIHEETSYKKQVWERSFHDRALRRSDGLKQVARYIILNPIRAGLVQRVGDYPLWDCVWL
tara:strand:- start:188 stop:643 length:456 start_codon:yes stop_codon:yes gene_type:complete